MRKIFYTLSLGSLGLVLIIFAVTVDSTPIQSAPSLDTTYICPDLNEMSKPTIVMFAGAFHQKEHLKLVLPIIEAKGYPIISQTLSTVNDSALTLTDDIAQMHGIFTPLFAKDKDVVLVIHSYAGMPGSAAIKGLSKAERASNGLLGGIIGVIYESAFIPAEGVSLVDIIGGFATWQNPDVRILFLDSGAMVKNSLQKKPKAIPLTNAQYDTGLLGVAQPIPIFYNDVPDQLAQWAASIFESHSLISVTDKSGPVGYQDTGYAGRLAYIRTEDDKAIPVAGQDAMMQGSGVNFTVEKYETGHSPFLSHPDMLADTLDKLAQSFVELE